MGVASIPGFANDTGDERDDDDITQLQVSDTTIHPSSTLTSLGATLDRQLMFN